MAEQLDYGTIPMTVSREVVQYFSIGLYQNFARAIKELISNAYDAGATEVKVRLDLLSGKIIIHDNGKGMDLEELEKKFLAIGTPTPLTEDVDELGRKRIGTFGIGAVAIFPYCEKITILTKKRNSSKNIELNIDPRKFFKGETFLIQAEEEQARFPYRITKSDLPVEKGETIIILENIKQHILTDLKHSKGRKGGKLEKYGGYEKFKWTLGQYCPLLFSSKHKELREHFEIQKRIPLRFWLDGEELFRNVPENAVILEKGEQKFGKILVKFVIMTPYGAVKPEEAKGLQVRLRDVGIGLPKDFEIIRLTGKVPGKLNWLCGEVHIMDGLNQALMIDRDSFSYTLEVAQLETFFRKKMVQWNTYLEVLALQDKELYEGIQGLEGNVTIIENLKDADIIKVAKDRLRISKKPISKSKRRRKQSASPVLKIKDVLTKGKQIEVEVKKSDLNHVEPIEISQNNKKVVIYENHSAFNETIEVLGKKFTVDYSNWNYNTTPSLCKVDESKRVIFNLSHPLFDSGLSDNVVKEISLGLFLIFEKEPNGMQLLKKIEILLSDVFLQRD